MNLLQDLVDVDLVCLCLAGGPLGLGAGALSGHFLGRLLLGLGSHGADSLAGLAVDAPDVRESMQPRQALAQCCSELGKV